jgi:hypothetical protein
MSKRSSAKTFDYILTRSSMNSDWSRCQIDRLNIEQRRNSSDHIQLTGYVDMKTETLINNSCRSTA